MGEELLVANRFAAGAEFVKEFNEFTPVAVALWIQKAESELVYLHIACDETAGVSVRQAREEALRRLFDKRSPWLQPYRVNVIGATDPIAREAIAYRDRFVTSDVIPYEGTSIGGVGIESAYIYPPVAAM